MNKPLIHKTELTEEDRHYLKGIGSHFLNNKQKDQFLTKNQKNIYSGQLTEVLYLGGDAFEYTVDGHTVKVIFPLDRGIRISMERPEILIDVPVYLEGLPLEKESSIILLQLTYPEQANEDSIKEGFQMEMPQSTSNRILYFTEGFKFCAFIFFILFTGQLFDDDDPERYRIVTYVIGVLLLAFIYGYFHITSRKESWLRPVPVIYFKGSICQVLHIIDNTGEGPSEELMYITSQRTFIWGRENKAIHPGDTVAIIFKTVSNLGSNKIDKPKCKKCG